MGDEIGKRPRLSFRHALDLIAARAWRTRPIIEPAPFGHL
jgi:hypothetical protein